MNFKNLLLRSSFCADGVLTTNAQLISWIKERRMSINVKVDKIPFNELENWQFEKRTANLRHSSGRFFSIEGLEIYTNGGIKNHWSQPIIDQPEIGFLGIIAKVFDGILYFLMQAKIEPGNINFVQLSPTLQATKSNYSKVHKGDSPHYLEYFNGEKEVEVLVDQLQSEQGARFYKKRNRNIIILVEEDIEVKPDFCWLTLGQIKELMRFDNLINMDTRTVISGINFGSHKEIISNCKQDLLKEYTQQLENNLFLKSAVFTDCAYRSFDEIISWITEQKCVYELEVKKIPLNILKDWFITDNSIHHKENKYFSVIAVKVHIGNREVSAWSQPLVESAQEGLIAFMVQKINGVYHFLVQAKVEAGNFDIIELAPTVQCLTGNYRKGENEYDVPFINDVLNCNEDNILYKTYQSEEGGRFYREQNLNLIIEVNKDVKSIPENFCWMTLNQIQEFIKYNNYFNIQARSLISAIRFV